jgi:parallel beta-helix repeat protein
MSLQVLIPQTATSLQIATTTNELIKVRPPFDRTDSETAAGVTLIDTTYWPGHVLRYGRNRTPGTTDMTAAFQAAVDGLPSTGGAVYVPSGDFAITSFNVAGTNNDKSNVIVYGDGPSSIIRQLGTARATGVPGGDTTQSPNVLYAYYGSGFRVRNLRIIGNKDSGGVKPTAATNWVGSTLYTFDAGNPTYRQTRQDGTAIGGGSELSTDKVWRLTATHTSHATDIDNDSSNWTLVTDFAALNGYYYDESFNRGMCVYFGGPNGGSEVTNVAIEHCRIEDAYYANVLCGSGPEKTGLIGAGCRNGRVVGCSIDDSSAGIGGLLRHDFEIVGNTITGVTGNGINCDRDGSNQTISGNVIKGHDTEAGRNGVSSYRSDHIVVTGNYIANFGNAGVNFQDQSNASDLAGVISGNTIVDVGQTATDTGQGNTGIVVSSSDHVSVTGNHIRNPHFNGIKVDDSNGVSVTGNTVFEAGAYGINFEDCFGFVCSANNVRQSARDNFYIEGSRSGAITGNVAVDGNTDDSATLYSGFRIGPFGATECSNITVTGNFAADTRTPKRQHYGLTIESASTAITVIGNDFTTNKDGDISNSGSNNQIGFNNQGGTASWRTLSSITPYSDLGQSLGGSTLRWANIFGNKVTVPEGISLPSAIAGHSQLFYHTAGAELSLMIASGVVKRVTGHEEDTAANIASAAATINTANKYKNKLVWDTTNNRLMRASGANTTDAWYVVDGSASVTPA